MVELFHHLYIGFSTILSVQNVLLCLVGCLVGTLIGVLPGIGPLATIAMLLPITFGLHPVGALIMKPEGDTIFPPIDPAIWREAACEPHPAGAGDDAAFDFVSYLKAERQS